MLTPPTLTQLATFTGRTEASFTAFGSEALNQGALMFESVTGVTEWPVAGTREYQVMLNGICEFSYFVYNNNPYLGVATKPFSSETIGSYTYTLDRARSGQAVGMIWWDEAIRIMKTEDSSMFASGGISVFENDGIVTDASGNKYLDPNHKISTYSPFDAVDVSMYPSVWS